MNEIKIFTCNFLYVGPQVLESPLVAVMSHLLSFLEQYSHLQQLQQQAEQYRMQLRRHRVQHRRKMKALRSSYRQRLRDKSNVIHSLEEAIAQQQTPSPDNDGKDICVALSFFSVQTAQMVHVVHFLS